MTTISKQQNPFVIFKSWLEDAKKHEHINEPTAMTLSTADIEGKPNSRIVLLKSFDQNGFCFFGNLESQKFQDLKHNPYAALNFHWMPLCRQVRIRGKAYLLNASSADEYFASRKRGSQISAHASKQSSPLKNPEEFSERLKLFEAKFSSYEKIPRPSYWSGYRLIPDTIEFWMEKEFRRHDRYRFERKNDGDTDMGWKFTMLYP